MSDYGDEAVDRLPFSTEEKSQHYRTQNYCGAVGLNWYLSDPTLQRTMAYYLQPDELAVAEPHLRDRSAAHKSSPCFLVYPLTRSTRSK